MKLFVIAFAIIALLSSENLNAELRTVIVNNVPVYEDAIDSITFEISNKPIKKIWKDGTFVSSSISNGENISFFNDLDLNKFIYESKAFDENTIWENGYITPIGYFFSTPYSNIMRYALTEVESAEDMAEDMTFWHYQSYDKLHEANIITLPDNELEYIGYPGGDVDVSFNSDLVDIYHEVGSVSFQSSRENSFDEGFNMTKNNELTSFLYVITQVFDKYDFSEKENELLWLINTFKSIAGLSVVNLDNIQAQLASLDLQENAIMILDKIKERGVSINYSIVPKIYDVNDIYDNSVRSISGRLCGGYTALQTFEYGILIDENPNDLTTEKASLKIPCRQSKLKLSYSTWASNLKPDTDYYYTAYCIIPKSELGTYHFRYGDKTRTEGIGRIKKFHTKRAMYLNIDIQSQSIIGDITVPVVLRNVNYKGGGNFDSNYLLGFEKDFAGWSIVSSFTATGPCQYNQVRHDIQGNPFLSKFEPPKIEDSDYKEEHYLTFLYTGKLSGLQIGYTSHKNLRCDTHAPSPKQWHCGMNGHIEIGVYSSSCTINAIDSKWHNFKDNTETWKSDLRTSYYWSNILEPPYYYDFYNKYQGHNCTRYNDYNHSIIKKYLNGNTSYPYNEKSNSVSYFPVSCGDWHLSSMWPDFDEEASCLDETKFRISYMGEAPEDMLLEQIDQTDDVNGVPQKNKLIGGQEDVHNAVRISFRK